MRCSSSPCEITTMCDMTIGSSRAVGNLGFRLTVLDLERDSVGATCAGVIAVATGGCLGSGAGVRESGVSEPGSVVGDGDC